MSKEFVPFGTYVLCHDMEQTATIDGIDLPDNVREKEMVFGVVIAPGGKCEYAKKGNVVAYGPYAGKMIQISGVEFRIVPEGAIEGVIQDAETTASRID